ncbi:MAG: hypothetical protein RI992_485, partial [Actinomycetota bacterium]
MSIVPSSKNIKTRQIDVQVSGMTCSSCVNTIEKSLNKLPGVRAVVNIAMESAHIIAPDNISEDQIIKAIKDSGYQASSFKGERESFERSNKLGVRLLFTFLLTVPVIAISMLHQWQMSIDNYLISIIDQLNKLLSDNNQNFVINYPNAPMSTWLVLFLSLPVVFILAWPIHRAALKNIFNPTMDTLVSLGSMIALTWSVYSAFIFDPKDQSMPFIYAEVSSSVILFVMFGRYLEHRAKRKAGSALAELFKLSASDVEVQINGVTKVIPINDLEIGNLFVVKPGERIATDGIVISGFSTINNSFITGEFTPVEVSENSLVFAGSINNNGSLIVKATRVGFDTELARITRMVLAAQSEKAPAQQLADRISRVFVPIVLLLSIATYIAWLLSDATISKSIATAVSVLVIACPCALGLATPIALMVASGKAAKKGIIIRSPRSIEKAVGITDAVFDKTGTLTEGVMVVQEATVSTAAGAVLGRSFAEILTPENIIASAQAIESLNNHPVAQSITRYALAQNASAPSIPSSSRPTFAVSDFSVTPGSGAAGRVSIFSQSPVVLIGSPAAVAHSSTEFHPEIKAAVDRGQAGGLTLAVLAWDGVALAVFAVGDQLKSDAAQTVSAL